MAAHRTRHTLFTVFLLGCLLAVGAGTAWASIAYVNNTNDSGPGSLRGQAQGSVDFLFFELADGATITLASPLNLGTTDFSFVNNIAGNALNLAGSALQGTGTLTIGGGGHFNFSNSVNVTGGLTASGGSSANITLADYTGGRVVLGASDNEYGGALSGKLNIQGQIHSGPDNAYGGGIQAYTSATRPLDLLTGSVISGNSLSVVNSTEAYPEAMGGGVYASYIGVLGGTVSGNTIKITVTEPDGTAYTEGGGVYAGGTYTNTPAFATLSGTVSGNISEVEGTANTGEMQAWGGGVRVSGLDGYGLVALSGSITGNTAKATGGAGNARTMALGGGIMGSVETFTGAVTNNEARATVTNNARMAWAEGGGGWLSFIRTLSGTISGNTATATAGNGLALAWGGGLYIIHSDLIATPTVTIIGGEYSNNTAEASGANAVAQGGALYLDTTYAFGSTPVTNRLLLDPTGGVIRFSGNKVKVNGAETPNAIHFGTSRLMDGSVNPSVVNALLEISDSAATGNLVSIADGVTVDMNNGKTFTMTVADNAYFNWGGPNVFDAAGGSTVTLGAGTQLYSGFSMDNSKVNSSANVVMNLNGGGDYYQVARPTDSGALTESFSFANTNLNLTNNSRLVPYGVLNLGDNAVLNLANGSGVDIASGASLLTAGSSRITGEGDISLSGAGSSITMNGDGSGFEGSTVVSGGSLVVDGSLGGTSWQYIDGSLIQVSHQLTVNSGGTLSGGGSIGGDVHVTAGTVAVDLNKTLTLGAASTFSLNGGTLSFGVGANNSSGKIVSLNTTTAPTFAGSNTLDLSTWIPGTYSVLQAGKAMAAGAPGTFSAFTVGGNALGAGMTLTPTLSGDGKNLILTAALNQDSAEKIWGGAAGTWNYTNANWTGPSTFNLGDLAKFDGTGAGTPASPLAVTVGGTAIETAGMSITGGSYTFSGGKIMGRTNISQGSAITPTGRLDIAGSGNIIFNNAVDFSGGLSVAGGSSANITLADYTGGRVLLGTESSDYAGTFSGKLHIQNQARNGAIIQGGGLLAYNAGTSSLSILSGSLIAGNSLDAQGAAAASMGGGLKNLGSIALLAGEISGNSASATSTGSAYAEAYGGGLQAVGNIAALSGTISGNTASAQSSASRARVFGGGVAVSNIASLSGEISGNTAEATATGGAEAIALGGGAMISNPDVSISKGVYTGNQAIATGANARAQGGALFLAIVTPYTPASLNLDPTAGAIAFSGNSVTANGVTQANAIHFGRSSLADNASANASLIIQDSLSTGNIVTIADGITTDLNNGKTFILSQTGGNFLWGGPNVFDSEGGDVVSLTGGQMRLTNDFTLDRGTVNGGTGLLTFNVTGGHLKSEGAATSLRNTALSIDSGGKLTVGLGSTLTLDANSTFALNSGTLSFGVNSGNASGKIVSLNTTTAPTFAGSNTLDISTWIPGAYTVLQAGTAMAAGAPGTFATFTVGGNALGTGMTLTPTLSGDSKNLILTAALNQDSREKIWGGASGTWNYTNTNWRAGGSAVNFVLADAALFDGTGAANQTVTLGGTSINPSGLRVTGSANYTLTGAALRIDSAAATGTAVPALAYKDKLVKDGSGTLTLNTGSFANPNKINTIEINSGVLALGDGFALEPLSGRSALKGNGGALNLLGTARLVNTDLDLANAFSLGSGNTLILSGSTLDKHNTHLHMTGGGTLVSAGTGNRLQRTTLNVNGGKLTVNLGSTLTLDANSTFALNSGTLSFGVGAGNASGIINMTANTTTAPTFAGSNTLDISTWIPGTYTVLQAGTAMAAGAPGTFQTFTVGGNALGAGMTLTPTLSGDSKNLILTATLDQDSTEKVWGGASGAWNYTNANWTAGGSATNFVLADAALFDGTGAANQTVTLGGTSINPSGLRVTGSANYTLTGAALRIDSAAATGTAVPALAYKDKLVKDGSGTLTLNTGSFANPNKINTIAINSGVLALGDGFALEPLSGRSEMKGNGGALNLLGTARLVNTDLDLANAFSLGSGNTLILSGSTLDKHNTHLHMTGGGTLVSAGTGNRLQRTTLNVNGGKLTVNLGSTLTLDANSTFALNSGTLSFGVGAGNASGIINMTANTTTAPTFAGSNTLDISTWIPGTYTVLQAGTALAAGAPGTFQTFTVGGNALGAGMTLTPTLSGDSKNLILTAALNQDSREKIWGGASGTWNYTNSNWRAGGSAVNFVLADAALFDGTGAANQTVTLGGASINPSGLRVTGSADYTLTGAALRIDSTAATGTAVPALAYKDKLVKDGSGTLTLNTGSFANPNKINTIAINSGVLALGDGFALEPLSGRSALKGNGGALNLLGTARLVNTDLDLANAFSLGSGNTLILSGSTLDKHNTHLHMTGGGTLVSAGTGNRLQRTTLNVNGGKLTVNLGSTLTLDANSTFNLNNGTLSFGVGADNAGGRIVSLNTATAPTFVGSNTLDISTWIPGSYTVLQAGTALAAGAPGTFVTFTVGGNAIDPLTMNLNTALANNGKDMQITAALARNNKEVTWNGASGTWNYTNVNWLGGSAPAPFLPGDAARFTGEGTADQTVTLGGSSLDLSCLYVEGAAKYTFTGAAFNIDSANAHNLPASVTHADDLLMEGPGTLLLQTGGPSNPNRIAGNVLVTGGTLALGNGFTLTNTGAGGVMNIEAASGTPVLDVRGAATLNNMNLQLANTNPGGAPELRFTTPNSTLALNSANTSHLGAGVMDVDLNRTKTLAAVTLTGGGQLSPDQSILRLRHTGLVSDAGTWLLVDGAYAGTFSAVNIATATLMGTMDYDTVNKRILFDGTYTVAGGGSGAFPGYASLPPNARKAWAGFRDAFYNRRTPFMQALNLAYSSPAAFQADLANILRRAHAEGAVSQGMQSLHAHSAAATAAMGYAFGVDASVSAQSFAPLALQASFDQGRDAGIFSGGRSRRDQAMATGRYADRMAGLDGPGSGTPGSATYSLLSNWQPATTETRALVSASDPSHMLRLDGPNTPFGVKIWGGYLGNFAHQDGKDGYAGYNADHNGFLLGGSVDIGSHWTVGAYAGYTSGDTRYNGISARVDTDATHAGAFARYRQNQQGDGFKATGDVIYSHTENDASRNVSTALGKQHMKGSFDQNIIGGGLELAYDWSPASDQATVLTPYLAGRYAHLEQDGFTESGDLGMKVGGTHADSFTTTVGVKAARDFVVSDTVILTPKATLGWLHQWADRDVAADSNFVGSPVTFITRSIKLDTDAAVVGVSLDMLIKTGKSWDLSLKLGYGADIRKNGNDQTVFTGFELKF